MTDSREYKDLIEAREFIRSHRVRFVNDISTPAWKFLGHAQDHIDRQLSALTERVFHAPDEPQTWSTAGLDPQFAEVPNAR